MTHLGTTIAGTVYNRRLLGDLRNTSPRGLLRVPPEFGSVGTEQNQRGSNPKKYGNVSGISGVETQKCRQHLIDV
jgi:hypothetical protein